ncbi:MAG: hypothetical protein WA211_17585, partial [Candidatus Acidiferrales bacterium]
SCSMGWAGRQENIRPPKKCFFLDSFYRTYQALEPFNGSQVPRSSTVLIVKRFISALLMLLSVGAAARSATTESSSKCRKNLVIDEFLLQEDAAAAKRAFETFRTALLRGNTEQVIAMVAIPADFVIDGRGVKFATSGDLRASYDKIFTAYVVDSVRTQKADELIAGWEGVTLSNSAVTFTRSENGAFLIGDVRPEPVVLQGLAAELDAKRLTCQPIVVEGRIAAYNWATHNLPGFENIYTDHFIVHVASVVSGRLPDKRIRVDFWGVSHLPDYNLPSRVFEPDHAWRIYLRTEHQQPINQEVCGKEVQETISFVDKAGREVERKSAITALAGYESPSYTGLRCFEAHKQFFTPVSGQQ